MTTKTVLLDVLSLASTTPEPVYLTPRPYAREPGLLVLLPLLPQRKPHPTLPEDVWRQIFEFLISQCTPQPQNPQRSPLSSRKALLQRQRRVEHERTCWALGLVCRQFHNVALPLLYSHCKISSLHSLTKFTAHLNTSDQKWDSIRRIPFSTPGRWVQSLDVSELSIDCSSEVWVADTLLNTVFPLLPFLTRLDLSLSMQLSRRSLVTLSLSDCAQYLQILTSVRYHDTLALLGEDPLADMVSQFTKLEELEVVGYGSDTSDDVALLAASAFRPSPRPLSLPRLHSLTFTGISTSILLERLTISELPALRSVVVTPYGDNGLSMSPVSAFLSAHRMKITSVTFHTPQTWPVTQCSPPRNLLQILPMLKHLSIEANSFALDPPSSIAHADTHPLQILWISRPTPILREEFIRYLPHLPNLREVRARNVRWAKKGMSDSAREAGFQGEMSAWRRLLSIRKIRMLDADGLPDSEM